MACARRRTPLCQLLKWHTEVVSDRPSWYDEPMEKETHFTVFRPCGGIARTFPTYREAWEFAEAQFAEGKGVHTIEQVN